MVSLFKGCTGLYDEGKHLVSARIFGNIPIIAYYYVDLSVGTPPQTVSVIIDTGSGVCAFPCKSCTHCGKHLYPAFDFDNSSTAQWSTCEGCPHLCVGDSRCSYSQYYSEGSAINGFWFRDHASLGTEGARIPQVMFSMGCHEHENKLFYTQRANGILGLGPSRDRPYKGGSLLEALFADHEHVKSSIFTLCLSWHGGRFVVGGYNESYNTAPVQWTRLITGSGAFSAPLVSMKLDEATIQPLQENAVLDSGSTFTYMNSHSYALLRAAIEDYCSTHNGCGARHIMNCWILPLDSLGLIFFPNITLEFENALTIWDGRSYLFKVGEKWCYSFMDDGRWAEFTLGAAWMTHKNVIFDVGNGRFGVASAECPQNDDGIPFVPSVEPGFGEKFMPVNGVWITIPHIPRIPNSICILIIGCLSCFLAYLIIYPQIRSRMGFNTETPSVQAVIIPAEVDGEDVADGDVELTRDTQALVC